MAEMSYTDQVGEWRAVLDSLRGNANPYVAKKLTEIRDALAALRTQGAEPRYTGRMVGLTFEPDDDTLESLGFGARCVVVVPTEEEAS